MGLHLKLCEKFRAASGITSTRGISEFLGEEKIVNDELQDEGRPGLRKCSAQPQLKRGRRRQLGHFRRH